MSVQNIRLPGKKQQNLGKVMRNGGLYFGEFTQLGAKLTRKVDTFPKTNIFAPKKKPGPKRIVFQQSIFRGYVCYGECIFLSEHGQKSNTSRLILLSFVYWKAYVCFDLRISSGKKKVQYFL